MVDYLAKYLYGAMEQVGQGALNLNGNHGAYEGCKAGIMTQIPLPNGHVLTVKVSD